MASTSARSTSAPVAAPPAWTTRAQEWPPSRASESAGRCSRSNSAPRAMSSSDPGGALVDEDAHGLVVAQAGAGAQGVGEVEVGRVLVPAEDGGHAALGPAGGGLAELALGQDAQGKGGGGPAAGTVPAGGPRPTALRPRCREPGRRGDRGAPRRRPRQSRRSVGTDSSASRRRRDLVDDAVAPVDVHDARGRRRPARPPRSRRR